MKKILITAHFTGLGTPGTNGRFTYIAKNLAERYDVELHTSDFSHENKMPLDTDKVNLPYRVTYSHEPGYKKNVSLKRITSHRDFAKNVKGYLNNIDKPDLIYCGVPSLDLASVVSEYAQNNGIPFIIDVIDLWPEAFKLVLNIPVVSNLLFAPMEKKANDVYSSADEIVGVSKTYADRALSVSDKLDRDYVVYLGTDLAAFDKVAESAKSPDGDNHSPENFELVYIGTLGHSYNIKIFIDVMQELESRGHRDIRFTVLGSGPLEEEFRRYAQSKDINCEFTGRLPYEDMVARITKADVAVNPIAKGAAQTITFKVGDYAAAGLPVISTQEDPEYRELLSKYNAGYTYDNNDVNGIVDGIIRLKNDEDLRRDMGAGNRRMAEELFDRMVSYDVIYNLVDKYVK